MRLRRVIHHGTVGMAFFLFFLAEALAQPISTDVPSLEWATANSSMIVRVKIEDVAVHPYPDGLHGNGRIRRYHIVSARVLETVKGTRADSIRFVHNGDLGRESFKEVKKAGREVVLFMQPWGRSRNFRRSTGGYAYAQFPFVVRHAALFNSRGGYWASPQLPVVSVDLVTFGAVEKMIESIRQYQVDRPGQEMPRQPGRFNLPTKLRGGYFRATLQFPLNAPIEHPGVREAASVSPVLTFDEFKEKFGKEAPPDEKPTATRKSSGYVGVHSLESMIADSDVVVRGVVDDFCFVRRMEGPIGDSYGVSMRVVESIKGQAQETVNVFMDDCGALQQLKRDGLELVLFLRRNARDVIPYPHGALEYRCRDSLWHESVIELNGEKAEVLFDDLSWNREPKVILERLRAAAKSSSSRGMFEFHPSAAVAAGSSIEGNRHAVVYLSVNGELEEHTRMWARSEDKRLRWLGARGLIYFKSDRNAEVLKGMLDDDAVWGRREMLQLTRLSHPYYPEFLVRWEAWHVLMGWGYDVRVPAFRR